MPRHRTPRTPHPASAPVCEPLEPRLLLAGDPPVITSITADNRGLIELVVDQALSPTTVNSNTVRVFTAGRDGLLGTSDDALASSTVTYDIVGRVIRVNAAVNPGARYRVQAFGDQILGNNGERLDAEFNGASRPTGNGTAGGTLEFFTRSFAIPIVRFTTFAGVIEVEMFSDRTPLTVENFFRYMNRGVYDTTFFHRAVTSPNRFIIQGGGFTANNSFSAIPQDPAVRNEPGISNLRGTIAMAKLGNNPNSATNQWFFNLSNNSGNLDQQNGGFTVFGEITSNAGLRVMDDIADFEQVNASATNGAFTDIPVRDAAAFDARGFLIPQELITVTRVAEILDLTAEPFKQLPTEGQVVLSSQSGATTVHIYSLAGVQLGSTSAFMTVNFSGDRLASIRFTGSIPSPIGIQIISNQPVGSVTDARSNPDSNLAFLVSNTTIGSLTLRGGFAGFDLNDTLLAGETLLPEDIDRDGRRDDPAAIIMLGSSIRTMSIGQNLNGSVNADQGVQSVTVRGQATNADFVLGPATDFLASTFTFARVIDSTIESQTPISRVTAADWSSTGQRGRGITAPSLGTLSITGAGGLAGDFQGDVQLTGSSAVRALNTATIKGVAFLSQWIINGSVGNISINGGTSEFLLSANGDIATFSTDAASSTSVEAARRINSIRASEWLGGRIRSGALVQFATTGGRNASGDLDAEMNISNLISTGTRSFRVAGDLRNSNLQFGSPVSGFSVGGNVENSTIAGTEFNNLSFRRVNNLTLNPTGLIRTVSAWEWLGGSVTGTQIRTFTIAGNRREGINGDLSATIRLTQPGLFRVQGDILDTTLNITFGSVFLVSGGMSNSILNFNQLFFFTPGVTRATIRGLVDRSEIIANDVVGEIVVGAMNASVINVGGTQGNGFFSPGTAFAQTGFARSITVGTTGSRDLNFVSSSIIGNRIDSIRLVGIDTANGNVSFGISARSLGTVEIITPEGFRRFSNPTDPFFINDFEIRPNFIAPTRA